MNSIPPSKPKKGDTSDDDDAELGLELTLPGGGTCCQLKEAWDKTALCHPECAVRERDRKLHTQREKLRRELRERARREQERGRDGWEREF